MKFTILTLFPDFIEALRSFSLIGRAIENGYIELETVNIRDFTDNKHGKVDDYSYGGGPGLVMSPQPIVDSIESVREEKSHVIYLSPKGKVLDQKILNNLKEKQHIIFLCGHYEGIDERALKSCVDDEISIGDYVLTGGEIPAMTIIDGISRLLPNVLHNDESTEEESHMMGLLEYPQYTRPFEFRGMKVPDVLLSGNHREIESYRLQEAVKVTRERRPDLLNKNNFSDEKWKEINEIIERLKEDTNGSN